MPSNSIGCLKRFPLFPEGTKVTRPAGGIVLWVELPRSVDSLDLYQRALERNISVAPGPAFSASQGIATHPREGGFRWCDRIEEAVIVLGRLATELASQRTA